MQIQLIQQRQSPSHPKYKHAVFNLHEQYTATHYSPRNKSAEARATKLREVNNLV